MGIMDKKKENTKAPIIFPYWGEPPLTPHKGVTNVHDDVIKWKPFPRYWPFVRGIHQSRSIPLRPVTRSFDVSLICAWINGWVNNREAGDLSRNRAHHDVTVMKENGFINIYV